MRKGHGNRATVRDVARVAGVSVATVSHAFNHPERLAPATRERVLQAAATLGYRGPDPAARSLRLGRSGAIALMTAGQAEGAFADPATALVVRGVARACDQAGVGLLLGGVDPPHADGIVLVRRQAPEHPPALPLVIVDGPPVDDAPRVMADARGAGAELAGYLAGLGHRTLAILGTTGVEDRLAGVRAGWPHPGHVTAYLSEQLTREHGEAAARAALRADPRPHAIIGLSDVLALGALDAAHRIGLRVPGDVSVAGIDDLPGSEAVGLTTVFVPYRPMGDRAGMLLAKRMQGAEVESPRPFPVALTIRGSTGPLLPWP